MKARQYKGLLPQRKEPVWRPANQKRSARTQDFNGRESDVVAAVYERTICRL